MKESATTKSARLTPAQIEARIAAHKPSWVARLHEKLNRLSFPSLTQGVDKLTEGKRLAGVLSLMRHYDPELTNSPLKTEKQRDGSVRNKLAGKGCTCIMAEVGRRLEQAILERDTKFLGDFRKASRSQPPLRDIYAWLLRNGRAVEACHSKGEILRLVRTQFPSRQIDDRYFFKVLDEIGLPLSKPANKRNP